jgi:hypothetical protein
MDDQTQKTDLQKELDELLLELKKDHQAFGIKSKVLVAKADRLADELEKTDFSDLDRAEKKAMKDLGNITAEEIVSLELVDEANSREE